MDSQAARGKKERDDCGERARVLVYCWVLQHVERAKGSMGLHGLISHQGVREFESLGSAKLSLCWFHSNEEEERVQERERKRQYDGNVSIYCTHGHLSLKRSKWSLGLGSNPINHTHYPIVLC